MARNYLEHSITVGEKVSRLRPESSKSQYSLALGYFSAAHQSIGDTQFAPAEKFARLSLREFEAVASKTQSDSAQYNIALVTRLLAALKTKMGDGREALRYGRQALAIDLNRAKSGKINPEILLDLSFDHNELGDAFAVSKDFVRSLESYKRSQRVLEDLLQKDPHSVRFKGRLADLYGQQGRLLLGLGRLTQAGVFLRQSYSLRRELADISKDISSRALLAESSGDLGIWQCRSGNSREGRELLSAALTKLQETEAATLLLMEGKDTNSRLQGQASVCGLNPSAAR